MSLASSVFRCTHQLTTRRTISIVQQVQYSRLVQSPKITLGEEADEPLCLVLAQPQCLAFIDRLDRLVQREHPICVGKRSWEAIWREARWGCHSVGRHA